MPGARCLPDRADRAGVTLAGVSTAVLEGGDGPPMLLLHGPGEFAAGWLPVFPDLVPTHRVIAPDLPGHGASTWTVPWTPTGCCAGSTT